MSRSWVRFPLLAPFQTPGKHAKSQGFPGVSALRASRSVRAFPPLSAVTPSRRWRHRSIPDARCPRGTHRRDGAHLRPTPPLRRNHAGGPQGNRLSAPMGGQGPRGPPWGFAGMGDVCICSRPHRSGGGKSGAAKPPQGKRPEEQSVLIGHNSRSYPVRSGRRAANGRAVSSGRAKSPAISRPSKNGFERSAPATVLTRRMPGTPFRR